MTPELAQLLDGPVAERFGRPRRGDLSLKYDDGWAFLEDDGFLPRGGICSEPEAIWLANLLGLCGDRGWGVQLDPLKDGRWMAQFGEGTVTTAPTLLEALATAMLQVPEDKPC